MCFDPLDAIQAIGWWKKRSCNGMMWREGASIREVWRCNWRGKRFGQLSLGSLGLIGSLEREIWEKMSVQV